MHNYERMHNYGRMRDWGVRSGGEGERRGGRRWGRRGGRRISKDSPDQAGGLFVFTFSFFPFSSIFSVLLHASLRPPHPLRRCLLSKEAVVANEGGHSPFVSLRRSRRLVRRLVPLYK